MSRALAGVNTTDEGRTGYRGGRLGLLARYRELMWMLAWRDVRVRYKHSLLGAAWAVVPPVAMMLIFSFVFGTVIEMDRGQLTGETRLPYSLFALAGLVPWTFFANGLGSAIGSLVSNRPLVTKIYFPREVFPIAAVGGAFLDFLVGLGVLILFAAGMGWWIPQWDFEFRAAMLALPLVAGVQIVLMLGLGLMLSMANLFYRDVGFLFRSLIPLWMLMTCVVYPLEPTTGWKRLIVHLNPMTPIIRAYRDCLLLGRWPVEASFWTAAGVSALILAVGWWWFRRREFEFAECI